MSPSWGRAGRPVHRRGVLLGVGLAIALTVGACSTSPQNGATARIGQAGPTAQPAADTAAGRTFEFKGMEFSLAGKIEYKTNLPQCPKPGSVVRIPAGLTAEVELIPDYTANCPLQLAVPFVAPRYPVGYLGDVSLLSGYDRNSFYVRIAETYAHPIPTLPAGSFEAKIPVSAATFESKPPSPSFLIWDSATNAILLINGPHAATLAAEVESSLREGLARSPTDRAADAGMVESDQRLRSAPWLETHSPEDFPAGQCCGDEYPGRGASSALR